MRFPENKGSREGAFSSWENTNFCSTCSAEQGTKKKELGGGTCRNGDGLSREERSICEGGEGDEIDPGPPKSFITPTIRVLYKILWSSTEASWVGCWQRQEQGVAVICSQMVELALVNKIQELTAWKCLGAQCFLQGHRACHSGLE